MFLDVSVFDECNSVCDALRTFLLKQHENHIILKKKQTGTCLSRVYIYILFDNVPMSSIQYKSVNNIRYFFKTY